MRAPPIGNHWPGRILGDQVWSSRDVRRNKDSSWMSSVWTSPFHPLSESKADAYLNMHVAMKENAADGLEPHDGFIASELQMPNCRKDRAAYQKMKDSIRLLDGHFHLPLLRKRDDIKLPDARPMAKNRLESLKRRLMKDKNLCSKY